MLMRCCCHVSLSRSSAISPPLGKNLIENASDTMKNNGDREKKKEDGGGGKRWREMRDRILGVFLQHLDSALFNANPPRTSHEPDVPSFLEPVWLGLLPLQQESWPDTSSPASAPLWAIQEGLIMFDSGPRQTSTLLSDSAFSQDQVDSFP